MNKRLFVLLALSLSCDSSHKTAPIKAKIPIDTVNKSEAPENCVSEIKECTLYGGSKYGIHHWYKCLTDDEKYNIYAREKYNEKFPWYETKLSEDISEDEFSEWCKVSFINYKWFREETD